MGLTTQMKEPCDAVPLRSDWIEEIIRIVGPDSRCNIIDVGANIGQVALLLLQYFPQASLTCFEPSKRNYERLVENLSYLENVVCLPFALGASAGEAELHIYTNDLCNTLVPTFREPWLEHVGVEAVKVVTLDQFAAEHKISSIDILKIDVEGYELSVLKGALWLLTNHRIRFVYAEVGFHRNRRHQCFSDLIDFMFALDYDLCGFYEVFKDGKKNQYTAFCNALFMTRPRIFGKLPVDTSG